MGSNVNLISQIVQSSNLQGSNLEALKARLATMSEAELQAELSKNLNGDKIDYNKGVAVERTSPESNEQIDNKPNESYTDENGNEVSIYKDGDNVIERKIKSKDEKGNIVETIVSYADGKPVTQTISKNGNTIQTTKYRYETSKDGNPIVVLETTENGSIETQTVVSQIDENGNYKSSDAILTREKKPNGEINLYNFKNGNKYLTKKSEIRDGKTYYSEFSYDESGIPTEFEYQVNPDNTTVLTKTITNKGTKDEATITTEDVGDNKILQVKEDKSGVLKTLFEKTEGSNNQVVHSYQFIGKDGSRKILTKNEENNTYIETTISPKGDKLVKYLDADKNVVSAHFELNEQEKRTQFYENLGLDSTKMQKKGKIVTVQVPDKSKGTHTVRNGWGSGAVTEQQVWNSYNDMKFVVIGQVKHGGYYLVRGTGDNSKNLYYLTPDMKNVADAQTVKNKQLFAEGETHSAQVVMNGLCEESSGGISTQGASLGANVKYVLTGNKDSRGNNIAVDQFGRTVIIDKTHVLSKGDAVIASDLDLAKLYYRQDIQQKTEVAHKATTTLMNANLKCAEEALTAQLNHDGWAAKTGEAISRIWGSDNTIEKVRADLSEYKKIINELDKYASKNDTAGFQKAFKKHFGVNFDQNAIAQYITYPSDENYQKAFGTQNNIVKRILDYNQSQNIAGEAVKGGIKFVSAVAAGTGWGVAVTALVSAGVEISDRASSNDGIVSLNAKDLALTVSLDTLTTAAGIKAAQGINTVTSTMSKGAKFTNLALNAAADTTLGAASEYMTTGDVTLKGTLINTATSVGGGIGLNYGTKVAAKIKAHLKKQSQSAIYTKAEIDANIAQLLKGKPTNRSNLIWLSADGDLAKYGIKTYKDLVNSPICSKADRAVIKRLYNQAQKLGYKKFLDENLDILVGFASQYKTNNGKISSIVYDNLTAGQYANIKSVIEQARSGNIAPEYIEAINKRIDMSTPYQLMKFIDNPEELKKYIVTEGEYKVGEFTQKITEPTVVIDGVPINSYEWCLKELENARKMEAFLNTQSLPRKMTVKRVEGDSTVKGINVGDSNLGQMLEEALKTGKIEELRNNIRNGNIEFTNNNFVGTTLAKDYAFDGQNKIKWDITLPKGSKAAFLEGASSEAIFGEAEVLLQRNSKFKITDVKYNPQEKSWEFKAEMLPETSSIIHNPRKYKGTPEITKISGPDGVEHEYTVYKDKGVVTGIETDLNTAFKTELTPNISEFDMLTALGATNGESKILTAEMANSRNLELKEELRLPSGLQVNVYTKGDEILIAVNGFHNGWTDARQGGMLFMKNALRRVGTTTNTKFVTGGFASNNQLDDLDRIYQLYKKFAEDDGKKLTIAGYSMGGSMTRAIASMYSDDLTTNFVGFNSLAYGEIPGREIKNYVIAEDGKSNATSKYHSWLHQWEATGRFESDYDKKHLLDSFLFMTE